MRTSWPLQYLAAIALVCAAPHVLQGQAKPISSPDIALAGISVGMDSAVVRKALGSPDSAAEGFDPSEAGPLLVWYYPTIQVVYLKPTVHGIWLVSSDQATARGLRVGDSVAVALRLYGPPTGPGSSRPPGMSWDARIHGYSTMFYIIYDRATITKIYVGHNID